MRRWRSAQARWGLLATTLVLGATLIGTTWTHHRGIVRASEQLARGQGETMLGSIRRELEESQAAPSNAALEAILSRHREAGLLSVALYDPRQDRVLWRAGARVTAPADPLPRPPPGDHGWARRGEVYLLVAPAGRPPPGDRGPRRGPRIGAPQDDPRPRPARRRSAGRPPERRPLDGRPEHRERRGFWLVLELEASTARSLEQQSANSLVTGTAGAVVLMIAAVLFWKQARARERAQRQLEQQQRLSTLGEMSAVLAHEIRNPLASLKGNAQLLAERLGGEGPEGRKIRRIVAEATRLEKLTSDLLDFTRSGALERRPTDPLALLEELQGEDGGERFVVHGDGAPASWPLDPVRFRQALSNLIRNAVQVSPLEAPVEVTVVVDQAASGPELLFVVRDRGAGLPPGRESEIFEPFFTTKTRGTGLGLAVARRIVELHGGRLSGRNHPAGGAELEIRIPPS